ncbi:MAG: thiamine-phosphate kinase [Pseudomonadota bacterium]
MDEFTLIKDLLRPLLTDEGASVARGLADDAAVLPEQAGRNWVVSKDMLVEGVHFPKGSDWGPVAASRLIRTNLSDLAAMGARPEGCFLGLGVHFDAEGTRWTREFVRRLGSELVTFGLGLWGGDTVRSPDARFVSLTILGTVSTGNAIGRSGAEVDDDVYVTGSIGDAAYGLQLLAGQREVESREVKTFLVDRYQMPTPRLGLLAALTPHVRAAVDVSDGLLADLGHIATASHVSLNVEWSRIPQSAAARHISGQNQVPISVLTHGDDYEIAFTAPPSAADEILRVSERFSLKISRIGRVVRKLSPDHEPVNLIDETGQIVTPPVAGFRHGGIK